MKRMVQIELIAEKSEILRAKQKRNQKEEELSGEQESLSESSDNKLRFKVSSS